MHEKDRIKILEAGFVLYRCSEVEKVIKRRLPGETHWKVWCRVKTKKRVKDFRQELLSQSKAIQD